MRQIVLDTETTGIGPELGHRVIEIGCVELVNRKLTGKTFHTYLNPERDVDEGAFRVHGISTAFLQDKPVFKEIVSDFIHFIQDAELIIHNAPFDVGFLNSELKHVKWPKQLDHHATVLDTLVLARNKHPGQRNSLDALCKRYDVNNSNRQLHGALLDAEEVAANEQTIASPAKLTSVSSVLVASEAEMAAHHDFVQFLVKKSGVNRWSSDQ